MAELINSFYSMHFLCHGNHQSLRTDPPPDDVIPIVGICADDHVCSCIWHTSCGQQVQLNAELCDCREQICTLQGEETTICYYIMKYGLYQFHVRFLGHKCTKFDIMMVCSFRWLMSSHLMMLTPPAEQNFITFVGGLIQLPLE